MSNNDKSTLNIPSFEDIQKKREQQLKQANSIFNSVRAEQATNKSPLTSTATTTTTTTNTNTTTNTTTNANTTTKISQPIHTYTGSTTLRRTTGNTILVNPTQQKNPLLKHIRNVPWELSNAIKIDYVVGQTTGVVYLSLRYHRLYPSYIYDRLTSLKSLYLCRILLVHVDVENYHDAIREINRIAILSDFTLMLSWSLEEAGRYLETYKMFEHKAPDLIRERVENEYLAKMTDCLTQIKSVNKTDVLTLLSTFRTLKGVAEAKTEELAMCPGFGEQKVRRVQQVWKQPFLANKKQKKK
ncbi:restriction endonuclease type II-like protein [Cokeromyces recurvatus]|uniref:restriction endonuclease type II-like protein n=1 Tax=Cokeromyces recurvatus TaxID=90255 RepID=UPI00221F24D8|nr:restriction endonuclease type II-like protein [Cokeromyces recurvatus]KAI7907810.1 restriction endonuclease type II-like protein [Cokeromyces recurvatus]